MDMIKMYLDTVIKPIEEKRNEMRKLAYCGKGENKEYIKYLEEYEKLLYARYMELGKIVFDEYNKMENKGDTNK